MDKFNRTQYIKGIIYPELIEVLDKFRVDYSILDLSYTNRSSFTSELIKRWSLYISNFLNLDSFSARYLTHGSSDTIYKIIASSRFKSIGIISNSYIGYDEFAKLFNKNVIHVDTINDVLMSEDMLFIIALPDTRLGLWIPKNIELIIKYLNSTNSDVWIDGALLGTMNTISPTSYSNLHLNKCIKGIFGSCSKTFGLNHLRHGFLFAKDKFSHLEDFNTWFSDNLSISLIMNILNIPNIEMLPSKYLPIYDCIINGNNFTKSECNLIGFSGATRISVAPEFNKVLYGIDQEDYI